MADGDARARWLEAARMVVSGQLQGLRCPEKQDGDLEVTWAPFPDQTGGEYWLRCPVCGAGDELLIHDHEPSSTIGPEPKNAELHDPVNAARISAALVTWTGYGQTSWPQRDELRLAHEIGSEAAAELLPSLRQLEDDFYSSNARYVAPDLTTMGQLAAESFRQLHPEISDAAIDALAWCYTWDYK